MTVTPIQELSAAAAWLGMQHADLSAGLKSAEDGLALWRYWMACGDALPPLGDPAQAASEIEASMIRRHTRAALGYNPWSRAAATEG